MEDIARLVTWEPWLLSCLAYYDVADVARLVIQRTFNPRLLSHKASYDMGEAISARPGGYGSRRHPTHLEPSSLDLHGIL